MDRTTPSGDWIERSVPRRGLREVLSSWSGPGELWAALAAVGEDELGPIQREWTVEEVERRANRILFMEIGGRLAGWPTSVDEWAEALPAESTKTRQVDTQPLPVTHWAETRRRGWPPTEFVGYERARQADTLLVTTLKWTLSRVAQILDDAVSLDSEALDSVKLQTDALREVLRREPLAFAEAIVPAHADLRSLSAEGWPWNAVTPVAEHLLAIEESDLVDLATRLVMPDPKLVGRLFHLGVLGELLRVLRAQGFKMVSRRALTAESRRPAYELTSITGERWDLWFEAAGVWSYYGGSVSPYLEVTRGVDTQNRALGADLLLIRSGHSALVLECKHSNKPTYVTGVGYPQVVCYAAEIFGRLAPTVMAAVVGPSGVVAATGSTTLGIGRVSVMSPDGLSLLVQDFCATGIDTAVFT